jgi:hypothetical protein
MAFVVMLSLDLIFLAPILYFITKIKEITNTIKSYLIIFASLIIGDLLMSLGYTADLIVLGQGVAWIFFSVILVYLYILNKGIQKKELLNLGGIVILAPLLLFITNNVGIPLIICYGIGLISFSMLLTQEEMELRASGAFGMLACAILLGVYVSQMLLTNQVDVALMILPRAVLLASLMMFGYIAIIPSECLGVKVTGATRPDIKKIIPSIQGLKSERRAISSEIQAMLSELTRIENEKGEIGGAYAGLRKKYNKEVTMLKKSASGKLNDMRGTLHTLQRTVEDDTRALGALTKELEEEKQILKKVKEVVSKEAKTTENLLKDLVKKVKLSEKAIKWQGKRKK